MSRDRFSDCGATDEEVLESLQEEFDGMQRTARAYAARCRDLEAVLKIYTHCRHASIDCFCTKEAKAALYPQAKPGAE
jgi:hypothetical protein